MWTSDLRTDPRCRGWGPAAGTNQIRGSCWPRHPGGPTDRHLQRPHHQPEDLADNDIGAIRTYAEMLAQLVGSVADPGHKGELAAQLQFALESRVLIEQAKRRPDRPPRLGDETSFELAALTLPTTGSAVGPRCRGLMQAANPMTPRPGSSMSDQR